METNDLHSAWKGIDTGLQTTSREELARIVKARQREMVNEDYYRIALSTALGVGFLLFLTIITVSRWDDIYLRINNLILGAYILYFQSRKVMKYIQLSRDRNDLPVREWMKHRIEVLNRWVNDRSAFIAMPLGFIFAYLSIISYISERTLIGVISDSGSFPGLLAGFFGGLAAAFLSLRTIRKKQMKNLEKLEELYEQMK